MKKKTIIILLVSSVFMITALILLYENENQDVVLKKISKIYNLNKNELETNLNLSNAQSIDPLQLTPDEFDLYYSTNQSRDISSLKDKQKTIIPSLQIEIHNELEVCAINCPEDIFFTIDDLKIYQNKELSKNNIPSEGYVFEDQNNKGLIGFWNRNIIIITTNDNVELIEELNSMNLSKIHTPFPSTYMVVFDQDLNELEQTMDSIKILEGVESVTLDLVSHKVRTKNVGNEN